MLTSTVIEGSNILEVTYDGALGADEMAALRERLGTLIQERGSARLVVEYGEVDLGRVEPRAMWEDLKSRCAAFIATSATRPRLVVRLRTAANGVTR